MKSLDRYLFQQLFTGFVLVAIALVCVLWLTQSLRFVEMIVNRGLGIGTFIYFTALLLPNFLTVILPVAIFASTTFVYSRLNMDRELPVLRACGMSNVAIAKPALTLATLVMVASYGLNLYLVPKSYELFRDLQWDLRNSMSHMLLREGAFNELGNSVTVYVRERTQDGQLLGVLVHDENTPGRPTTLMAKRGALVEVDGAARVILFDGNRQVVENATGNFSMLYFDRYTHEVTLQTMDKSKRVPDDRELPITQLLEAETISGLNPQDIGTYKIHAHQRILSPFLILSFSLAALCFLVSGQFSRRGQLIRILSAIVTIVLLQVLSLGFASVAAKNLSLVPVLYGVTLLPIPLLWFLMIWHRKTNPSRMEKERQLALTLETGDTR